MEYKYATAVPIGMVTTLEEQRGSGSVRKMMDVLQRQGQIEPLQVRPGPGLLVPHSEDPHGDDIVRAARALGWATVLVVTTKRYE